MLKRNEKMNNERMNDRFAGAYLKMIGTRSREKSPAKPQARSGSNAILKNLGRISAIEKKRRKIVRMRADSL